MSVIYTKPDFPSAMTEAEKKSILAGLSSGSSLWRSWSLCDFGPYASMPELLACGGYPDHIEATRGAYASLDYSKLCWSLSRLQESIVEDVEFIAEYFAPDGYPGLLTMHAWRCAFEKCCRGYSIIGPDSVVHSCYGPNLHSFDLEDYRDEIPEEAPGPLMKKYFSKDFWAYELSTWSSLPYCWRLLVGEFSYADLTLFLTNAQRIAGSFIKWVQVEAVLALVKSGSDLFDLVPVDLAMAAEQLSREMYK